MKKILNYIGQIRIYSLIDLILLLIALKSNKIEFIGIIFLYLSFLIYLETKHSHKYREKFPKYLYSIFLITGIVFYKKIEIIPLIIVSYLYAQKNKYLGELSPLFRGLQYFLITGSIIGYNHYLTFLVLPIIFIRNFLGDIRDISRDKKEKIRSLPMILGFKKEITNIHLIAIMVTSIYWWSLTNLSIIFLVIALLIETLTYNITPR